MNYPLHTVVLVVMGMVGLEVIVWLSLSQTLQLVPTTERVRRAWRWTGLFALSGWLLVRLALAFSARSNTNIVSPYITETFILLALIGIVPLVISPVFRQMVRTVPLSWLIGIHVTRFLGFVFLGLLDMKLMPAEFALPAGYGDILAALLALVALYLMVRQSPLARAVAIAATVWGILDFVIAIVTGTLYIRSFVTQLVAAGISPQYLNYVLLIPAFAVPLLMLLHVYSLVRLFSARAISASPAAQPELG